MANWWTSCVQLILCTVWMRSRGVLPQQGHGGPQGAHHQTGYDGPQGTHHQQRHVGPQGALDEAGYGEPGGRRQPPQDHFDFDDFNSLPGVQHEFKIDIGPRQSECFFQWAKRGSELHISFEVLRGADRNVDVFIRRPDGQTIDRHLWTSAGNTDTTAEFEGDYAVCIDNERNRFSSRLVYLFIATFAVHEWQKFADEAEALDVSIQEVQVKVDSLHKHVTTILQMIGLGRRRSSGDYYVALTNNQMVQLMSIILALVFITTSAVQVYFVKHMFKSVNVTPTQKPRA